MQFLTALVLLCNPFLALAHVSPAYRRAIQPISSSRCEYLQPDGSITIDHDCTLRLVDAAANHVLLLPSSNSTSNTNNTTNSKAAEYKAVIRDLTTLGYNWVIYEATSPTAVLAWNEWDLDSLVMDTAQTNGFMVEYCFNKWLDENPQKVPLRDILLSYWSFIALGGPRSIADLEYIVYDKVVEQDLALLVPDIYNLMGKDLAEAKKEGLSMSVNRVSTGNEQIAYQRLVNGAPFCAGATKMLAEYAEFGGRQVERFEFKYPTEDSHLTFTVHFPKTS